MKNNNPSIDIAKGMAIILVVYGHVIEHSMAPWGSPDYFLNPVFKVIYTFHMPLFVFISGYLIAYSLKSKSLQAVFNSRCKSLFVPFVSLGLLGILVTYVLNAVLRTNGHIDITGDLADQLILKPSVWFLFTLFALSSLLIYSVSLDKRFGVFIFAAMYFLLVLIPFNDYCALYFIKWFYPFYLAGYLLNRYGFKISDAAVHKSAFAFALLLFVWALGYWTKSDYIYINKMKVTSDHYFYEMIKLMYRFIIGFLGIFITFYLAILLNKTKLGSVLGRIGNYSLDIYVLQMFFLEGLYPRWVYKAHIQIDFNSPGVIFIFTPFMTMLFVIICLLISKFFIRKIPLLNKLLLGGRA